MKSTDTYRTIDHPGEEVLFKNKNSKFFGYSFPIADEEDVKNYLEQVKKQHHSARHFCYAWQLGIEEIRYRTNDDGEPNNSAGMPIYGQIQSYQVTNILMVIVRYFGGIKLGVGGLIQAYKYTAQLALETVKIENKIIEEHYKIVFPYTIMDKVMRIIKKQQITIINQESGLNCVLYISIRKKEAHKIKNLFKPLYEVVMELSGS